MAVEWLGGSLVFDWPVGLLGFAVLPILIVRALWSRPRPWTALGFRLVATTLVVLAIAGTAIESREPADEICLVLATDVSSSVSSDGTALAADWEDRVLARLRPGDRFGGVVFAARADVVQWPTAPPRGLPKAGLLPEPGASSLEAGIEGAIPLCPEGSARTILLLTDGNETVGSARRAATLATQAGVRLFAAVAGASAETGFTFEKLTAPPLVREGSVFPLRLVVRGRGQESRPGTVSVLLDDETISEQAVEIDPGVNVFEISHQLAERGSYRLAAVVRQEDINVRREMSLAVAGPIRALLVGTVRSPAVARALELRDIDVEMVRPANFPKLDELLAYHCVILDDVRHRDFPGGALEAIESYVKNFGGGLVMTGGVEAFGDRGYRKSALERTLPILFRDQKPRPRGRSAMGVVLLIDRSNSMSYNSRVRGTPDGEKMSYAKKAAQALVRQLGGNDHVGVIAFDSDPYVIGPLKKLADHRRLLEDRISRLLPGGGTDFKASLEIAMAQLTESRLPVRHVILLTDGDTNRGAGDHDKLIDQVASVGISVTTIRIGTDDVNLELLRRISRRTGGQFHHVQDIESLPQLIVSDTKKLGAWRKPGGASSNRVRIGRSTAAVRGFRAGELPRLRKPVRATLERGADRVLYAIEDGKQVPLLATWQYGLGRAAAFLLDPTAAESRRWVAWEGFAKLWSQLTRWATREDAPWETRHTIRFEEGRAVLELRTFGAESRGSVVARIFTTPEKSLEVELAPVAPRLYRAALPSLPSGRYPLMIQRIDGKTVLSGKRDVLVLASVVEEGEAAELARKLPDIELLREITAIGGGTVDPEPEQLLRREGRTRPVRAPLDIWLISLALPLLLADIWIRRRSAKSFL